MIPDFAEHEIIHEQNARYGCSTFTLSPDDCHYPP